MPYKHVIDRLTLKEPEKALSSKIQTKYCCIRAKGGRGKQVVISNWLFHVIIMNGRLHWLCTPDAGQHPARSRGWMTPLYCGGTPRRK